MFSELDKIEQDLFLQRLREPIGSMTISFLKSEGRRPLTAAQLYLSRCGYTTEILERPEHIDYRLMVYWKTGIPGQQPQFGDIWRIGDRVLEYRCDGWSFEGYAIYVFYERGGKPFVINKMSFFDMTTSRQFMYSGPKQPGETPDDSDCFPISKKDK